MLDQVLQLFNITPDYDLDLMRGNQSPSEVTIAVLRELEPILRREAPDWVLVQGDTTTVMAASLAAFYQQVKIGHVEAGLRTRNIYQPFPEEVNRRIAGVVAQLNFAPTGWAANNLLAEQVPAAQIVITGNTVIDAIRQVAALPYDPAGTPLADLPLGDKRLVLVTAHRRESFGRGITAICEALREIARTCADVHLVYPVHMNPNVWEPVHQHLQGLSNVTLTPPLEYLPLVYLMKQAYLVVTDSGGIQEEAPGLGVPVLVLREVTERPEGVQAGTVRLVGTRRERIVAGIRQLLEDETAYRQMARAVNPYGDGRAAERTVKALLGESFDPWEPQSDR